MNTLIFFLLLPFANCDNSSNSNIPDSGLHNNCVPGEVKFCPCIGGTVGVQSCADNGNKWLTCTCSSSENEGNECTSNCNNKNCGTDGCGGICGICGENEECIQGHCFSKCVDIPCGKTCCTRNERCINNEYCCLPSCYNKECGNDGCGGSCGQCNSMKCENGKCIINCTGHTCGDNCCLSNQICLQDGKCCTPNCDGKECGDDGCGGKCGVCQHDSECVDNICKCIPKCENKECGSDGCNGTCGNCDENEYCDLENQCKINCDLLCGIGILGDRCGSIEGCLCPDCQAPNYACQNGYCKVLMGILWSCNSDWDCYTGFCILDRCAWPCESENDCPIPGVLCRDNAIGNFDCWAPPCRPGNEYPCPYDGWCNPMNYTCQW